MASAGTGRLALMLASAIFLTACEEGSEFKLFDKPLFKKNENSVAEGEPVAETAAITTVEKDVEAPEVFEKSDAGLWDGRPSLGGIWVAHPDVVDPERVIIRNESNGKFVIGALFRRERENPGPRFQVSSDAASELGMLAGSPSDLKVTAMRRVEVEVVPDIVEPAIEEPEAIEQTTLDPVTAVAASAIEAAETAENAIEAAATAPSKPTSSLEKPYIQIGIFSVEANANRTADMLRKEGVVPTVKRSDSSGKTYWRVIVGPATNSADRTALMSKIKELGFADAYAVTN